MYYFSFQAKFEDQLYSLQPSLFFNDVVALKDRVDLSWKTITHALYYIRRVPLKLGGNPFALMPGRIGRMQ